MKKNMVPLLAIAFIVAIISTGVFYGLFAGKLRSNAPDLVLQQTLVAAKKLESGALIGQDDVRLAELRIPVGMTGTISKPEDAVGATLIDAVAEGEPITRSRLAARTSDGSVPKGMRAVSIRITDSAALVTSIRPGVKVDVQAVSAREGVTQLKTLLQNVEVLSFNPRPEPKSDANAAPVATVLVHPSDVDVVALADSGARIRVALRNPLDNEVLPRQPIALTSVFQGGGKSFPVVAGDRAEARPKNGEPASAAVALSVWLIAASASALEDPDTKMPELHNGESIRLTSLRSAIDAGDLVQRLAKRRDTEILTSAKLKALPRQAARFEAGPAASRLRLEFLAGRDRRSHTGLQVKSEISWRRPEGGVESRTFETEAPGGPDFLLSGLLRGASDQTVLDKIFPGHPWTGRDLLIVVSAPQLKQIQAAALAKTGRRR